MFKICSTPRELIKNLKDLKKKKSKNQKKKKKKSERYIIEIKEPENEELFPKSTSQQGHGSSFVL